jgi:hypothetical protein
MDLSLKKLTVFSFETRRQDQIVLSSPLLPHKSSVFYGDDIVKVCKSNSLYAKERAIIQFLDGKDIPTILYFFFRSFTKRALLSCFGEMVALRATTTISGAAYICSMLLISAAKDFSMYFFFRSIKPKRYTQRWGSSVILQVLRLALSIWSKNAEQVDAAMKELEGPVQSDEAMEGSEHAVQSTNNVSDGYHHRVV